MKRYIENKISSRIQSLCSRLLSRFGFSISIQEIRIVRFKKLLLIDVTIKDKGHNIIANVESILCKLSLWQSISGRWLAGELKVSNFTVDWKFFAESIFLLPDATVTFGLNSKKAVVLIEVNEMSLLSNVQRKNGQIKVLSELSLSWDSYMSTMDKNLNFDYLKNFHSSSLMLLNTILTYNRTSKQSIHFNAFIKAENFTLSSSKSSDSAAIIDKQLLLSMLFSKHGGNYFAPNTYIPYEDIPEHLINAIICTEDPNYWSHKGIDIYGINYAIVANIKSKKFERGASTITMQLVRNLFLNHDKNIIRKVEECVITLLIENYFKVEKRDILELYVNLIEFAPNVYGLHKACLFYFGKPYYEFTLLESLVLTYIIPRPKHFYEALLVKSEQLRRNLHHHIQLYAIIMLRKWLITYNDYKNMSNDVKFSSQFDILTLPNFEKIPNRKFEVSADISYAELVNAVIILDNGHGNNTSGKRSPVWDDGTQLFEFEFNRDIVHRIADKLQKENIRFFILVPEFEDISLEERCKRANSIIKDNAGSAIAVSIHANGGGGTGWECFTAVEKQNADKYAKILCEQFREDFSEWIMRFSPSPFLCRKESFYILNNIDCPTILSENFFMDNEKDCRFIMSEEGRERIASTHAKAIKQMLHLMFNPLDD